MRLHPQQGALSIAGTSSTLEGWDSVQKTNLTYCYGAGFTTQQKADLMEGMQWASAGWEGAGDVDFIHLDNYDGPGCTDANTNVLFNVRYFSCDIASDIEELPGDFGDCDDEKGRTCNANCSHWSGLPPCGTSNLGQPCRSPYYAASAFYPSYQRSDRVIKIANLDTIEIGDAEVGIYFVMRHELGHILGYMHEFARSDFRAEYGSLPDYCDQDDANTPLTGPLEGAGDIHSVMMYRHCGVLDSEGNPSEAGYFTVYDLGGQTAAYGPAPTYDIAGGDFDGDGVDDVIVRSGRSASLSIRTYPFSAASIPFAKVVDAGYLTVGSQFVVGRFHDTAYTDVGVKFDTGIWCLDYAHNGLNGLPWGACYSGYGGAAARVAVADYDGDGRSDMATHDGSGVWRIDYSSVNDFGAIDAVLDAYGDPAPDSQTVPADYDGDGRADIALRTDDKWLIDYSNVDDNHDPCPTALPCFGEWNEAVEKVVSDSQGVPADWDSDSLTDISIIKNDGAWLIDYAHNGFGVWDEEYELSYGDPNYAYVAGKFHLGTDDSMDLVQKWRNNSPGAAPDNVWRFDFAASGYGSVDQETFLRN